MSFNSNNKSGPGPIPKRWLKCPRRSDTFVMQRFMAFKTPLSTKFDSQVPDQFMFTPTLLFELMASYKIKIGLWIDLTNTSRFYDKNDVREHNCEYVKLQCRGFGETPSFDQTSSFNEIVDNFINTNPTDIVGVHCTHGFNRTGFLIVSYMVEKTDCSVEAALQSFASARPPGIYKEEYIRELYRRYGDESDAPPAPPLPDWCYDEEETADDCYDYQSTTNETSPSSSNNHHAAENSTNKRPVSEISESPNGTEQGPTKKRKAEFLNLNATFMAGVSGVSLLTDKKRVNSLQQLVQEFCEWQKGGFPGSQPVSMDRNNISLLHRKPYRVSWKADGTRYMMLIKGEGEIFFFDRDNSCFEVNGLSFPTLRDLSQQLTNTLVDGEMVIDKHNGLTIPRYLLYDIIRLENRDVSKEAFFPNRLNYIKKYIIEPRYAAIQNGIIKKEREPFSVRDKQFWELTATKSLLGPKFAKSLSHEPDGLIFQPSVEPYVSGRCDDVLKWKPESMNSVDFKLKISEESGVGILSKKIGLLYVGGLQSPFSQIKYAKHLKDLDNKIIECKYENSQWIFMRERTDKSYPNSYNTAMAVCNSIKFPITKDHLLDFIDRHRFTDDSDNMPPPQRLPIK